MLFLITPYKSKLRIPNTNITPMTAITDSFLSKCFDLRESLGPQQALGAGAAPLPAGGGRDRLDGLPSFERFPKIKNPIKEFQAERSIS